MVSFRNVIQTGFGSRIDTEGLIVNIPRIHKMGSLLIIKAVQVRNMLHVICVKLSGFHHQVRLDIVLKLHDIQLVAVVFQNLRCLCKDLRVRNRGCRDLNGLSVARDDLRRLLRRSASGRSRSADLAAFHHKGLPVIRSVGLRQCRVVGRVEELFLSKLHDLIVQPFQQRSVPLGDRRGNGILASQGGNAHHIARIFDGVRDHLGIVIGPCNACSVLKGSLGRYIGIEFLKPDLRIVLFKIGLRRRS